MKTLILVTNPKFPLGHLVITTNAQAQLGPDDVQRAITRHVSGDWGDVCPDDACANDQALEYGDRLLSVYGEGERTFWIITEADRSVTTVLMPEDY